MTEVPERVLNAYESLPFGWRLEKLKFFAEIRNSNVDKTIRDDEQLVQLCNYTDVYYNDSITPKLPFMEGSATEAEIAHFHLKRNQIIITKDSEQWDDIGIPALVTDDMPRVLCGYHLSVISPGSGIDGGFLAWLCRAEPLNDQFKLAANGVTRFGLGQYPIKNAFVVLPPLATQQRIARFLGEKMSLIDELIEKKSTLLVRLAEKRQALINRAITKGLNPDVPMKPSGIDWLGDIPGDWKLDWLKWTVELATRRTTVEERENLPYISNEDITSWTGKLLVEDPGPDEADSRRFEKDDVLFNKLRPYLAKVYHAAFNGVSSSELLCLRSSKDVHPRFLFYVLVSKGFIDAINAETFGAKMPRADWKIVGHQPLPLPSLNIQQQIARFLDDKTDEIDELIVKIEESRNFLTEYRSALITQAVTGQLAKLR